MNTSGSTQDWADMRLFLAVADHGNLSAASEQVGLSQPTLGRRLAALEARMNVSLFVRTPRRMQLTDAGQAILENARRMEREMLAIGNALEVQSGGLSGEVRITATEGTGTEWLAPELAGFRERYPDILIYVHVENATMDLLHREADIALRLGQPKEPDLIARHLVSVGFGLYASEAYLAARGGIESLQDLEKHDLIALKTRDEQIRFNFGEQQVVGPGARYTFVSNSPAAQISAARAGFGVASVSHRWASMYPELKPLLPGYTVAESDLWLLTHEELRHSARIRAVFDYLAERIKAKTSLFRTGAG